MDARQFDGTNISSTVANSDSNRFNGSDSEHEINSSEGVEYALNDIKPVFDANATEQGLERRKRRTSEGKGFASKSETTSNASNKGLQRSKNNRNFREIGENRNEQFAGCVPSTWENFPTESPLCSRNDGLSSELVGITISNHRNESIKGYGNSIVPQVVY